MGIVSSRVQYVILSCKYSRLVGSYIITVKIVHIITRYTFRDAENVNFTDFFFFFTVVLNDISRLETLNLESKIYIYMRILRVIQTRTWFEKKNNNKYNDPKNRVENAEFTKNLHLYAYYIIHCNGAWNMKHSVHAQGRGEWPRRNIFVDVYSIYIEIKHINY